MVAAKSVLRPGSKSTGRPRRLSLDQVLDAAQALGLEGLTMGAVAKRLGVSVTVLYGYVSGREELVRLAAARATQDHPYPTDSGQHWANYVAQSAVALHAILTGPGQIIVHFLAGGLGAEVEIDQAEAWLEKLTASGFTVGEALIFRRQMGEIVVGGAVTALHLRALELAGRPFEQTATAAIAAREGTVPLLTSELGIFAERLPVWQHSLVALIEAISTKRGETLDRDAVMRALTGSAI